MQVVEAMPQWGTAIVTTCIQEMADRQGYVCQDVHWLEIALPSRLITCGALRCADALPFDLPNNASAAQHTCEVVLQPLLLSQ